MMREHVKKKSFRFLFSLKHEGALRQFMQHKGELVSPFEGGANDRQEARSFLDDDIIFHNHRFLMTNGLRI